MTRSNKEPTLFKKLITIYHEQALRRKALRLLVKQSWSVEFLTHIVMKAAALSDKAICLQLTNRDGVTMTISSQAKNIDKFDDNIFNHLDDDLAINEFIRMNSTR